MLPTTADIEGDLLLDHGPALHTLLHDGGAVLAGHHVQTRLEEDSGGVVSADQTVAYDGPVVNVLLAEETFLDPRRAARADSDVATRREENISTLVRTHQTLVQQLLVRDPHHPVAADDPLHRLAGVGGADRALLQSLG